MMSNSATEIMTKGIQKAVEIALSHVKVETRDELLGPVLSKHIKSGVGKVILEIACHADGLRVVLDTLLASGKIGPKGTHLARGFVALALAQILKIRNSYAGFTTGIESDILPFLKHYQNDNLPFGYRNENTRWSGIRAFANIAAKTHDNSAYQTFCNSLLQFARALLMANAVEEKEKVFFESLKKKLNSIKAEVSSGPDNSSIADSILRMVKEDFETMNTTDQLMDWLNENHWRYSSWLQAAQSGDPRGEILVGVCHMLGTGIDANQQEAIKWFRSAANRGHPEGKLKLADSLLFNDSTPAEKQEAIKIIRQFADEGNLLAKLKLGHCYEKGNGVPRDTKEALKYYRIAAESGHIFAQSYLGSLHDEGRIVNQDKKEAAKWYLLSAGQGNKSAMLSIGKMYCHGDGIEQDIEKGLEWMAKSAELGEHDADVELGKFYLNGPQAYRNPGLAFQRFFKVTNHKGQIQSYEGMFLLGICFLAGLGTARDKKEGLRLIHESANNLWEPAEEFLKNIGTSSMDFDLENIAEYYLDDALLEWLPNNGNRPNDIFAFDEVPIELFEEGSSIDLDPAFQDGSEKLDSSFNLENTIDDKANFDQVDKDENCLENETSDHGSLIKKIQSGTHLDKGDEQRFRVLLENCNDGEDAYLELKIKVLTDQVAKLISEWSPVCNCGAVIYMDIESISDTAASLLSKWSSKRTAFELSLTSLKEISVEGAKSLLHGYFHLRINIYILPEPVRKILLRRKIQQDFTKGKLLLRPLE